MKNKLARIKYLPNNFEILDEGIMLSVQYLERKFSR